MYSICFIDVISSWVKWEHEEVCISLYYNSVMMTELNVVIEKVLVFSVGVHYSRVPFTASLVNTLCSVEALFQHESAKVNYLLLLLTVSYNCVSFCVTLLLIKKDRRWTGCGI